MIDPDDDLMARITQLDPVALDAPPAVGSPRFNSLKDQIMQTDKIMHPTNRTHDEQDGVRPSGSARGARSNRRVLVGAGLAAAMAITAGTLVVLPGSTPSASATVLAAAHNSAHVTDFRIKVVTDNDSVIPGGVATGEIDGDNVRLATESEEIIVVDGTEWLLEDGVVVSSGPSENIIPPYGESSELLITTALASDSVSPRRHRKSQWDRNDSLHHRNR